MLVRIRYANDSTFHFLFLFFSFFFMIILCNFFFLGLKVSTLRSKLKKIEEIVCIKDN